MFTLAELCETHSKYVTVFIFQHVHSNTWKSLWNVFIRETDAFLLYKAKDPATSLYSNENANDWNKTLQACEEHREKKKSTSSASVLSSQANTQIKKNKKQKKKPLRALCSEIIIKTKPAQYTATCVTDVCRTVLKPSKQPVHQAVVSPAATRDSAVHHDRAMRLELKENHWVIQFKMRQFSVFICI